MKPVRTKEPTFAKSGRRWATAASVVLILLLAGPMLAQTVPVQYTITLSDPVRHIMHVSMRVQPAANLEVQLPVWNALYQIRDFSRNVLWVKARDSAGNRVAVRAIDKTTWSTPRAQEIEYEIVCDEPGPFGAVFDAHHAFLNLAEVLMYAVGLRANPTSLKFINVPGEWKIATAMAREGSGFAAKSYDAMVDSPVEIGRIEIASLEQKEGMIRPATYRLAIDADRADYDMRAILQMVSRIVVAEVEWMHDQPFDEYWFIYHFPRHPAGGGMEHAYSTAIDSPADRVSANPYSLASVTAHEFFHLWNVKRIRPQSLEPVDYTKEQYTRALWFSEGVTNAVADYMRVRAGYLDEQQFLAELAADIRRLESRPARLAQSVEESSLNAWLEKYPDYDQPERSISYYDKGKIVGMLLDLRMREVSSGKKSLRDLFRWMNEHYARQGKTFPDSAGVEEAVDAVTGQDMHDFFAKFVGGVEPIPYDAFFKPVGLRLDKRATVVADAGFRVTRRYGPLVVTAVDPDSGAARAGLQAGDIVQEFNGRPVLRSLEAGLQFLNAGDSVQLKVVGPTGQRQIKFKLAGRAAEDYVFVEVEGATPAQRSRRAAWIRGDSE